MKETQRADCGVTIITASTLWGTEFFYGYRADKYGCFQTLSTPETAAALDFQGSHVFPANWLVDKLSLVARLTFRLIEQVTANPGPSDVHAPS